MTESAHSIEQSRDDAVRLVARARRIAVVAHVHPDADAIGSVLGLALGLRALGKDAIPALSDPLPNYARFLPGSDRIVPELPPNQFDLFIVADSAGIERLGNLYLQDPSRFQSATIVNLDHHRTNPLFGTVNYVDPSASSTSEMSYHLLRSLGAPLDAATANALLFGIVGDTGSFRNGATTPCSLQVAAELVAIGADSQQIAFQLFEYKTFGAARLWGRVLSAIELDPARGIVFARLSQEMLAEEGATVDETEGIVEYLRGISEAEVVMLLKETPEGEVRVSMRSRSRVDVSAIAAACGGGGHRQAAGCTIAGTFARARAALVDAYDRLNSR